MTPFETAWGEITLVLFTTLAPSGVVAFIIMSFPLLSRRVAKNIQRRIQKYLCIPLVLSMVGLVASATHLGNPSNALYVFSGIGRSPLSNEVFCAVIFLSFAGVYWLYSFSEHPCHPVQRALLMGAWMAGVVFVTAIALAYSEPTIISWDTCYVPLNLWLNALVGGPSLALLGLHVAGYSGTGGRLGKKLIPFITLALVINVISYGLQGTQLPFIRNAFATASELVPYYVPMVVVYALFGSGAIALLGRSLASAHFTLWRVVIANILVLFGIFIMRFAFYLMHMTVGLGV